MSKKNLAAAVVAAAVSVAAFLAGARKAQAQAQPAAAAHLEFIGGDRDTAIYHFKHEGRNCYVATTRGGSGISLQCVK